MPFRLCKFAAAVAAELGIKGAPLRATLVEGEEAGAYSLIWSCRSGD